MNNKIESDTDGKNSITQSFRIGGMTCGGCARRVEALLRRLPITVDEVQIGRVTVSYSPSCIKGSQIAEALATAGYPAMEDGCND